MELISRASQVQINITDIGRFTTVTSVNQRVNGDNSLGKPKGLAKFTGVQMDRFTSLILGFSMCLSLKLYTTFQIRGFIWYDL